MYFPSEQDGGFSDWHLNPQRAKQILGTSWGLWERHSDDLTRVEADTFAFLGLAMAFSRILFFVLLLICNHFKLYTI